MIDFWNDDDPGQFLVGLPHRASHRVGLHRSDDTGLTVTGTSAGFVANAFFHSSIQPPSWHRLFVFTGALINEAGLADRIVVFLAPL